MNRSLDYLVSIQLFSRTASKLSTFFVLFVLTIPNLHAARPNIVFFLVDDLGQRDLGCYGSTFYETPNIDRLARRGLQFTDAYAACPVCSPTRASIITGQWPHRFGITDYIGAPLKPELWKRNTRLLPAPYEDRLPLAAPTMAKSLKTSGYATFFAGKWHLGPEGFWPENQGFDINMGGIEKGGPYGGNKYFSPYGNPRLKDGPEGEHLPDRLADEVNRFIESNRESPFFVYFSFYSVHTPLMARPELQRKYEAKRKQAESDRWGRESERDVRMVQNHAVYASMVEAMDQAVGKVVNKLDALGLTDNTLIIFTSDNGGLSTSEGWPTSNAPLRAGKGWLYEGGIRVPLIIQYPAIIKNHRVSKTPVISPDFFPTILEACGIEPPKSQILDGVSLMPLCKGDELATRSLYWHYPHYGNQGGAPGAAIRKGDWKLIEWNEENQLELYNVVNDISETKDLVGANPEMVRSLQGELHSWQSQLRVKHAEKNRSYDATKPSGRAAARPNS